MLFARAHTLFYPVTNQRIQSDRTHVTPRALTLTQDQLHGDSNTWTRSARPVWDQSGTHNDPHSFTAGFFVLANEKLRSKSQTLSILPVSDMTRSIEMTFIDFFQLISLLRESIF